MAENYCAAFLVNVNLYEKCDREKLRNYRFPGVYVIRNCITGRVYVGSGKSVGLRFGSHLWLLRRNDHFNRHLQFAFNATGEDSFDFYIACRTGAGLRELLDAEQRHIDFFQAYTEGFNLRPRADKGEMGEEAKALLSDRMKLCVGEKNPFFGKKHSDESRKLMSESHSSRSKESHPNWGKKGSLSYMFGRKQSPEWIEKRIGRLRGRKIGTPSMPDRLTQRQSHLSRQKNSSRISWDKSRGKWMVYCKVLGKFKNFGRYSNKSDAETKAAEVKKMIEAGELTREFQCSII